MIFAGESGKGVVLLGAIAQDVYDGPFAISYDTEKKQLKVNAGYLNRNGEWKDVARKELAASTGTVCVCTTLGSDGKWTDAEVAHSWFNRFRKLLVRYEKSNSSYEALLHLAAI